MLLMVTITVTDVNEPPAVTGSAALTFAENDDISALGDNTYTAMDPEDSGDSTWSVTGTDSGKFDISNMGVLTFKASPAPVPDFEMPGDANTDNVYEVTVVAADVDGKRGTMDVKVTVTNTDEGGTVTLSKTQPRVGVAVRATVTDPDGSISGLTWQWYRDDNLDITSLTATECAAATSDDCVIKDAMSDTHTPTEGDVDETLTAVAMYTDGQGAMKSAMGKSANMVALDTRNRTPAFEDQDTETDGVQNESTERKVEENAEAVDDAGNNATDDVGRPVMAEDPDPNEDKLTCTLGGADAGSFTVRDDGRIEVGDGTKLDYETKTTYEVTVIATDSFGASATIIVTINVTDMDETPDVTGEASIEHAENDTGPVATYTAADPEGTAIASWSLDGDDVEDFSIAGGVLTFKKSPDFEDPKGGSAGNSNMYSVTVQATDETNKVGRHEVTVDVTDVDEPGTVSFLGAADPSLTSVV